MIKQIIFLQTQKPEYRKAVTSPKFSMSLENSNLVQKRYKKHEVAHVTQYQCLA